jgi:hypothetical protein
MSPPAVVEAPLPYKIAKRKRRCCSKKWSINKVPSPMRTTKAQQHSTSVFVDDDKNHGEQFSSMGKPSPEACPTRCLAKDLEDNDKEVLQSTSILLQGTQLDCLKKV